MTTLRQLTYLVAIADERHFGRAAKRVNVAQPTLSAQFAELERKLGTRLVERGRSGVSVTPLGREIVSRARKVLADVQEINDLAASEFSAFTGRLKLGVPPTLGPYLLPHVVPEMHRLYPRLKLYVQEAPPWRILDALASGDLDMVLTPTPVKNRALEVQPLFREKLHIVCAPDHRFASLESVSVDDLRGEKVLALESGHHLHDQVHNLCNSYGAEILYDFEGTSLDTLRHMVGMDVGISFFPELYILSEIRSDRELKVLELDEAQLSRKLTIVWRNNSNARHLGSQLQQLIKDAFDARHSADLKA
jgi:LysR family hydrogen peroxide-inducible transcriptional activator